ncbi:tripartite tricarboxylate transporter substrate binding protein [Achromobacter sp. GG226]|uniref:Bug family tripartite tricarboxylate transporter substrate binding protein n=1 Tax=Verticiella alkaliphila TaxID=2779529 RepID=UPI001C0CBF9E|nr:tripartite tricarboxylate transporter substrate binding protein [Verticiella sp. GG226]MBU4612137.1 tripartite tricarboxylate transporter substrate binding protein [Verticiella sp. GG226]
MIPYSLARFAGAILAILAICAVAAPSAHAQSDSQPVRLIVGSAAGSAPDMFARLLAEGMSGRLGQTVLVENRSGANGNIAAQAVLQQAADGNTLWVGTQSMVEINPSAFQQMPWKPEDFTPIIKAVEAPLVLAAHPSVPATDFKSLISWLESRKGSVSYASFSPGTPSHFLGHQLSDRFKLDLVHIPYRGSAPQVTDLMGGHALIGFTQLQSALPAVQGNRLKAFATTGATRTRQMPDVPTLHELGLPEFDTTIWFGLLAPAKTPVARIDAVRDAAAQALADPDMRSKLEEAGFDVSGQTGEPFVRSIEQQRTRWAALVKATGFSATE